MGVVSVLMSFFLALVACRATGETDITPIGAMGKITQLFYGVVAPATLHQSYDRLRHRWSGSFFG